MREIVAEDQPFVREESRPTEALRRFDRAAVQARDHRGPRHRRGGRRHRRRAPRPRASTATTAGRTSVAARTCRRPSGSARSSSRRSRARTGAATRSARSCQRIYGTAWASEADARGAPRTGSRRPRSATTASSAPSSTCSRSPRRSARASRCSIRRAALVRTIMEDYSRRRHEEAGYQFVNSPHITKREPVRRQRAPRLVRRRHVPADGARRRHRVLPQADELPVPHPDLPQPHAVVPRAAAAAASSSAPCTATRSRASCTGSRACAGMTQDDAHIFCTREQMVAELAVAARRSCSALLRDYGLDDFYLELSTKPEEQGGRHRRGVGRGHRGAARRSPRPMTSSS